MSEEDEKAKEKNKEEHMIPKSRLDEVLDREKKTKELADGLAAKLRELEEKQLAEANDYKALYERTQTELAQVKLVADSVESANKTLGLVLSAQIAEIPEAHRSLVPSALPVQEQLNWISKNKTVLLKAVPVDIGAGSGSHNEDTSLNEKQLSEDEVSFARNFGMKPEEYRKHK